MKLERLEIFNFAGITKADIDLSAPVNVILGYNAAGKTSVKNAVEIVMCEGLCESRGYHKKNQAPELTHRGAEKWKVGLTTNGGVYERRSTKIGSSGNTPAIGLELARIAVDPQAVLTMKPADRQRVFSQIAQDDSEIQGKITDYLKKEGFGDSVRELSKDLNKAQEWAVEQRRAAKRVIAEMQAVIEAAPPPVYMELGKTDLSDIDIQKYETRRDERADERDKVLTELGAVASQMAQISPGGEIPSVDGFSTAKAAQEKALKGIDTTEAEDAVRSAKNALDMAVNNLRKKEREIEEISASLTQIGKAEDSVEGIHADTCPYCGTVITETIKAGLMKALAEKRDKVQSNLKLLDVDRANAQKKVEACQNKLNKHTEALNALNLQKKDIEGEIQRITQQIEEASRFVQLKLKHDDLESQKADVEQKLEALTTIISAHEKWDAHRKAVQNAELNIKSQENLIEWADKLDKLLRPDGEVRKIANEKLEGATFDNELLHAWGMETLRLGSDGTITLYGAPIESACATEQYRAGVLLAELLSRAMGLGILILDGVDLLRKPLKDALFARLTNGWGKTFESIVLLSAVDTGPQLIYQMYAMLQHRLASNSQLEYHWIQKGEVGPLEIVFHNRLENAILQAKNASEKQELLQMRNILQKAAVA